MTALAFRCTCGTVTGSLDMPHPRSGMHALCHCNSCRSAEIFLGQPDPRPEGVHLYQTVPDRIRIATGGDRLGVLRLSDKTQTFRWYATCCNAPLCITSNTPGFPFASLRLSRLADPGAVGPVRCEAFVPKSGGGTRHVNVVPFVTGLLSRAVAARVSGRWRDTPFFDAATRKPRGPVRILTADERAALPLRG